VTLEEGVPKFPAITEAEDAYMSIDSQWTVQYNYSLTYTVTVDEMKPKESPMSLGKNNF